MWSVEHGSFRDDEVNLLRRGGDYGWHPVPGYNEAVPMTDFSLPGRQYAAEWRSGSPTKATSGGAWVVGEQFSRVSSGPCPPLRPRQLATTAGSPSSRMLLPLAVLVPAMIGTALLRRRTRRR